MRPYPRSNVLAGVLVAALLAPVMPAFGQGATLSVEAQERHERRERIYRDE